MKKIYILFLLCCAANSTLHAQRTGSLWNDTSWSATGSQTNEEYGVTLSYLGAFDSATNALAIGESGGSSWILNKKRLDTVTQYFAPGQQVIPCNLSGTGRGDYVIYNKAAQTVMVLYATDTLLVFDTVLSLQGSGEHFGGISNGIIVADVDSSDTQSLLLFDNLGDSAWIWWFKGGIDFDTVPVITSYRSTGEWRVGKVRDTIRQYLCECYAANPNTTVIYLYPFTPSFKINSFQPSDSIKCVTTQWNGNFSGGFLLDDVDGDNIQDIVIGGGTNVLIYKGGATISSNPTYVFNFPQNIPYGLAGPEGIYDIGHSVSSEYKSILATAPRYGGDLYSEPGAIFLYNIGKGLDSNCAAYATEAAGTEGLLGTSAIGIGKYPGDTLDGFMVGAAERVNVEYNMGEIFAFKGNSAHGTSSVIRTRIIPPQIFSLSQNYPNPVSGTTTITLSVLDNSLVGSEVTLKLYDALGRFVRTLFRSKAADGYEYTIGVNTAGLPEGNYFYRLEAGGRSATRMMSVMK